MKSKIIAFMICLFSSCLITQTVSASTINNDGEIGTAYRVVVYDLENESNYVTLESGRPVVVSANTLGNAGGTKVIITETAEDGTEKTSIKWVYTDDLDNVIISEDILALK